MAVTEAGRGSGDPSNVYVWEASSKEMRWSFGCAFSEASEEAARILLLPLLWLPLPRGRAGPSAPPPSRMDEQAVVEVPADRLRLR